MNERLVRRCKAIGFIWVLLLCGGCSSQGFDPKSLAKTDVDVVTDLYCEETLRLLEQLLVKLYKRNPRELHKSGMTLDERSQQLFALGPLPHFDELGGAIETEALALALREDFQGDRVFALMTGLVGVWSQSYNHRREFFFMDELDQQKLYLSARNIEILLWRLKVRRDSEGQPLIMTNGLGQGEEHNLSFERLFGKLIAHQDMLAAITAGRHQRAIAYVARSVASMAFIPL